MTDTAIHPDHSHRWQAVGALVFGACVIGFSGILVRLTGTGPAAAGVWRLVFALPLLAVMTRRASGPLGKPTPIALLCGLFFALDLGFWHYGLKYTSVGASTVLSNLAPVVVTAFAWIFLKQRPRALFLLAMTVAVAGAWMMGIGRGAGAPVVNAPLGNALSLTTAFWYALYFLAIAQGRKTQAASRLMFWSGAIGAPLLLVTALLLGEQIWPTTLAGLAACIGLGFVHFAGQGSIAWAMGRLPTSLASVVVLVQPVVATYAGFVLFGEALGPLQTAGAVVALSGVVLAQWASRPRTAAASISS
ncbi:MAG TPA: EamA family transporter [Phenylobacterium sp.]|uniref:DMT family transporter n=1 Tax=Phenylobacterium sp. TaxID=1871053 RepID=UPI002D2361F0|nr:EamA family transporter [Phenylobacterium sp.]HZZ67115.1 EamA family transporter [Phenylobacterium sp.]